MTGDDARSSNEELQFDRVVSNAPARDATGAPVVTCVSCKRTIDSSYFHVNGRVTCASCRGAIESAVATPTDLGSFLQSLALGILAAIAGAILYFAILFYAHIQLSLLTIAQGYMVGWAIRRGNGNRGGLRYQVMAVVLTYWSVALAYLPLYVNVRERGLNPLLVAVTALELPVLEITHEGVSAILSVIIIGIGLYYAWHMTAGPKLTVSGPYRVGGDSTKTAL